MVFGIFLGQCCGVSRFLVEVLLAAVTDMVLEGSLLGRPNRAMLPSWTWSPTTSDISFTSSQRPTSYMLSSFSAMNLVTEIGVQ